MREILFFDLDGTITDSAPGIINSVKYALNKFGIVETDQNVLKSFIGPPITDRVKEVYGFNEEKASLAIKYYREYFPVKGIYENSLYDGVKDVIKNVKNIGKKIYLATSKPKEYAEKILKYFDIFDLFDGVFGATFDGTLSKKDDIVEFALKSVNANKDNTIMIGDRKYDVLGGKKFGLITVGVLYGYGDIEELTLAGADYLAKTPSDLEKILINI